MGDKMTVGDLKNMLEEYDEDSEVVVRIDVEDIDIVEDGDVLTIAAQETSILRENNKVTIIAEQQLD